MFEPTVPEAASPGPRLSIVVPMKDEAQGIDALMLCLSQVIDALAMPAEVIAVDDGSSDDTLDRLKAARRRYPYLKAISLSRNFGKEIAVLAGLEHARGQVVVLMDADLSHPPEAIPEMVARWHDGWQVIYGRRTEFRRAPMRGFLTQLFYRAFRLFSDVAIDPERGDFMVLDAKVVAAFTSMRERHRFTRALVAWSGFRTTSVPVSIPEGDGRLSRWSLRRLISLAVNALTSFGTLPLRVWTYAGSSIAALSLCYALFITLRTLIFGRDLPGFATLAVAVTFLAGVQLMGLGILGEYIGRIFAEAKGRPLYFVQESVGFDAVAGAEPQEAPVAEAQRRRRRPARVV